VPAAGRAKTITAMQGPPTGFVPQNHYVSDSEIRCDHSRCCSVLRRWITSLHCAVNQRRCRSHIPTPSDLHVVGILATCPAQTALPHVSFAKDR